MHTNTQNVYIDKANAPKLFSLTPTEIQDLSID